MFIGIIRTYERAAGTEVVETDLLNVFKVFSICQTLSQQQLLVRFSNAFPIFPSFSSRGRRVGIDQVYLSFFR